MATPPKSAGPGAAIIAHRGASHDAPENTLASIQLGWEQGADAVEIDVQYSKDGRLVVIHDDTTAKTAGVRKRVCDQTLAELRRLDVGRWKDKRWAGERIATLDEALATVPAGKTLFVEIKCGPESLGDFERAFRESGLKPAQVIPIAFALETLQRLKGRLPALEMAWIVEFKRSWNSGRWSPPVDALIEQVKEAGLDGLDVGANGPVNPGLGRKLRDARLHLYCWTVDSVMKARRMIEAGVEGITTNRPGWLRQELAKRPRTAAEEHESGRSDR